LPYDIPPPDYPLDEDDGYYYKPVEEPLEKAPDLSGDVIGKLRIPALLAETVGVQFCQHVLLTKAREALVLLEKQAAYGPHNIGRPPTGISPEVALTVRINDKVQRLGTLLATANAIPQGSEPRKDAWLDISNYGTIGTLVETGRWPGLQRDGKPATLGQRLRDLDK